MYVCVYILQTASSSRVSNPPHIFGIFFSLLSLSLVNHNRKSEAKEEENQTPSIV